METITAAVILGLMVIAAALFLLTAIYRNAAALERIAKALEKE
jgi:uncharacterized membrane protein (DUF485 family)